MEELYGILEKAHKETGHGGRDRMIKHLNNFLCKHFKRKH
jgi:hypothetical protein